MDLAVPEGTVLGLLGPNGAGKTTAVRILTTLLPPDAGAARVAGYDVVREAAALRAHIGLAGQYAAVDENLSGFENLEMVGRLYHLGRADARRRAGELLERFALVGRRPSARAHLLGRHAAAPRPGRRARGPATGPVPGRAHDRPRPAQPDPALGGRRGPRRAGHDGPADDPVPRRGRPARGPDRGDRPWRRDRRGDVRRAEGAGRRRPARGDPRGPLPGRRRRRGARADGRGAGERPRRHGGGPPAPPPRGDRRGREAPRRGGGRRGRPVAAAADARRRVPRPHGARGRAGRGGGRARGEGQGDGG